MARTDYFSDSVPGKKKGALAKNSALVLFTQAWLFIQGLLGTVVLARLLFPEDFGLIGMVMSFVGVASVFKDAGFSAATLQAKKITHEVVSSTFWLNVVVSGLAACVVASLSGVVSFFYAEPRLFSICLVLSVTFLLSGFSTQHYALLRRSGIYKRVAVVQIGSNLSSLVVAIALALMGFSYWALVIRQIMKSGVEVALLFLLTGWIPGKPKFSNEFKLHMKMGGGMFAFKIVNYLSKNLDNMLIGKFLGAEVLGFYSRAYNLLLTPIRQVNTPLSSVAVPSLSRLQDDPDEYRVLYRQCLSAVALLTFVPTVFVLVSARELILIVLGERWIGVLPIYYGLGLAALFGAMNVTTGWVYIPLGRMGRQFSAALFSSIMKIIGFFIGLNWGAVGVAWSLSIVALLVRPVSIWYCFRGTFMEMADVGRSTWRPVLASALSGGAMFFLAEKYFVEFSLIHSLLLKLGGGGLLFCIIGLSLPGTVSDLKCAIATFRKLIRK